MMICFFFLLGVINIEIQTQLKQHPILKTSLYQTQIYAEVCKNDVLMDKQILTLEKIKWINPDLKMPQKIRVHFMQKEDIFKTGDKIKASVSVYPPKENSSGYQLWYEKIGAFGQMHHAEILEKSSQKLSLFERGRYFIKQHLFQILPFAQAEVMVPLITGERKTISRETYQIYRRSGIAHVLSVSGFHMALLSTFLFFLIRSLCAFFPKIALYWNSKKLAALFALVGTFLYLGLSGFQIPAVRAFIMISFVFLGILIERRVISMRSLILAAFFILIMMPQMLLSVSFQLSFSAVAILIVICNYIQNRSWSKFVKVMTGFILLNICVAIILTPFILYHFHQFTPYGILGNMLFSTLFSFLIMPVLFAGCLLIPFGGDKLFFYLAGYGLDIVYFGARKISNFPHAELNFSFETPLPLVIFSFGMMMFCLMKTPLR